MAAYWGVCLIIGVIPGFALAWFMKPRAGRLEGGWWFPAFVSLVLIPVLVFPTFFLLDVLPFDCGHGNWSDTITGWVVWALALPAGAILGYAVKPRKSTPSMFPPHVRRKIPLAQPPPPKA